ncbi:MAG: yobA [Tardiphaga sp.]|jgi:methionine-rich copper-binding protein CopC|uniref:copper homeostasis periplasmic binding protein CopC n=1 Tax=Tardiphaga sp. TaxID=1926292 RepID=UPI002636D682|nr:copper homeostasis periplasmic binding protein CopC [Tardiphaga sp.]MDB5505238.1 yobA [Tardiphaga sp.]
MKITASFIVLLGGLLSCDGASAHAHLTFAVPADVAVVTSSPTALSLSFTEGLELALSGATLTGPDGKAVSTGPTSLGATDDKVMSIAIPDPLGAGAYTVDWHAFSDDGHATHGTYHFTVGQ